MKVLEHRSGAGFLFQMNTNTKKAQTVAGTAAITTHAIDARVTLGGDVKDKLRELNQVARPGKVARIKLVNTIAYALQMRGCVGYDIHFDIPAWVARRGYTMQMDCVVTEWVIGAKLLHDPYAGKITQQTFLEKWETVIQSKDFWLNRDQTAAIKQKMWVPSATFENLTAAAAFLGVAREVVLVGILADKALRLTICDEIDPVVLV